MIDFGFDDEQQLIDETVKAFASEQIRPAAHEADESGIIPQALIDQSWELGLIQSQVPEAYGGYGQSSCAITGTIVAEGLAGGDLSIALHMLSPRLVVDPVLQLGTEEQKKRILPLYCGDTFVPGSAAVVEPVWNFHSSRIATRATSTPDGYRLDGQKSCVPLAAGAPHMVVYAVDDEGVLGAFIVDQGTPGMTLSEREKNLGLCGLETYEVGFEDCQLTADARLGTDASGMLRRARIAQSAMAAGVASASLRYAIDYAKERDAFGVKIAQKQAIAFKLADMATETDAARLLNWEAAWKLDAGEVCTREIALASQYANEMVMRVTDDGLQVLGGHGFIRDHPVELWARNGRGFTMFEGIASL